MAHDPEPSRAAGVAPAEPRPPIVSAAAARLDDGRVPLAERYRAVRSLTERLADRLSPEDQVIQPMPDASPTKWHRAHTTWFFETFVLLPNDDGYVEFDPAFAYLFNSYYEAAGPRHPRPDRGLISRPSVNDVAMYRSAVDAAMATLLDRLGSADGDVFDLIELGLHHEQQHQELLLMDIKATFSVNPIRPAYRPAPPHAPTTAAPLRWHRFDGGTHAIGHSGDGFSFDNELPRHEVLVAPFEIAGRLVTAGEWLDFIADGGYRRADLWLSEGWHTVQTEGWDSPLYWNLDPAREPTVFTLDGQRPIDPGEPVCHVSLFEADAYASWVGARLPTEAEWEVVAGGIDARGANLLDTGHLHPRPAAIGPGLQQLFGDAWEWTQSAYSPYPGFATAPGAVGEYNGKFMINQNVLRGGCCATPPGHVRASYRNFFPASARWPFTGVRLARDPS